MLSCRTRMVLKIVFLCPFHCHVSINLGRVDLAVSQDRLYGTEIRSTFHHLGRATVAQHVRPDIAADCFRARPHDLPEALPGELFSAATDENQRRILSE